jgi:hypothetical protein
MTQTFWVQVGLKNVFKCDYVRSLNLRVSLEDVEWTHLKEDRPSNFL